MEKKRILFVCQHNSARSQIAEAFMKQMAEDRFEAESAGLEPGILNPLAIEVMREVGIDISGNRTKGIQELVGKGRVYDYIIMVCDAKAGMCPVFPASPDTKILHWSFEDPSSFEGTNEEKTGKTRKIRDAIRNRITDFIKEIPKED